MPLLNISPSPATSALIDARISIIVGKANNDVIGHQNRIPWHLSEDLKHFKATTLGHTIIMGRKTYDSIGKPLPGRKTVVISRNPAWRADGVTSASSLADAISRAGDAAHIFIAGGADIFREAMPIANRMIVTEIDLDPQGEILFPPIDPKVWQKLPGKPQIGSNGTRYVISVFERRKP